ncbi:MAG: RsmD family RNA methyltransferase [Saprospiraceae bacterium]|nr:RsmD family RNA methyltransferase [Saprospiraceae bacterium]
MRIISGQFRGRRFHPPADKWPTRPTTDIAKEGLFNILMNWFDFEEIEMLDLFGGTGSHTYEALSRGCPNITFVDRHGPAIAFVHKTLRALDCVSRVQVVKQDVMRFVSHDTKAYDYIFAGPPYGMVGLDDLPELIMSGKCLQPNGLFVLEHNANHSFDLRPDFHSLRTYGGTHFSFFHRDELK